MSRRSSTQTKTGRSWRRWTADDARSAVDAWKASGKSLAAYARDEGVSKERLWRWRRRLERDESLSVKLAPLVPVVVTGASMRAGIVLRVPGGFSLEIVDASGIDPAWLVSVSSGLARALV